MKLETFYWEPQTGWSIERFPQLDSDQTLVLLWGASSLLDHPAPLQQIQQAYPHSHLIGCSTAGEILGSSLLDHSLCVSVAQFQQTLVRSVSYSLKSELGEISSDQAGRMIAQQLADPDLQGVFLLADGLQVNGSQLIEGLNSILNQTSTTEGSSPIIITGGLAADNHQFKQTWVLDRGLPKSGSICAVGFYGQQVQISAGCQSGWTIFGPQRQVTRAQDNILYELDGKPALRLYQEYLGEQARNLPTTALFFPLAISSTTSARKPSVLSTVGVDELQQALILAGNIPEGAMTQLMRGNYERLVDGALAAALINRYSLQRKMQQWDKRELDSEISSEKEPLLAIAISGSGRRLVLGERTEEELEVTLDELPDQTQQIGFYSYGEFAPYGVAAICQLHNQTMTLTTIRESMSSGDIPHSASPL